LIRVGILGAKGYAAGETLRWLLGHPEVEVTALMARVDAPEPIEVFFPVFRQAAPPIEPIDLDALADRCDAVYLSLPHTTSQQYAPALIRAGVKVIDLSADFRFDSVEAFERTYGVQHLAPELNAKLPYALPELFGAEIPGAPGLACPGCYPTATILGLAPLMAHPERFDLDRIVVNAFSGVSGAGRKAEERYSFVECNESAAAYSVGNHRHRPEIEEKLARLAGRPLRLAFTTHLIPMNRGILATSVVPIRGEVGIGEIESTYHDFYAAASFVRLHPPGKTPATADVFMTNYCDVGFALDSHAGVLIVISALDNLVKGAGGQAVQAMNLLYGLPETLGLIPQSARRAAV
jgi:N-acetyl-gamma-glutamyl-phosphate reductase